MCWTKVASALEGLRLNCSYPLLKDARISFVFVQILFLFFDKSYIYIHKTNVNVKENLSVPTVPESG